MTPPPFDSRPRPRESDDLGCAHRVPRLPQAIRVPRAAPAEGRAMCSARGRARMRRVRRPRAGSTKRGAAVMLEQDSGAFEVAEGLAELRYNRNMNNL